MEEDVEQEQPTEPDNRLPARQYYGLLLLITLTLSLLVFGIVLAGLETLNL